MKKRPVVYVMGPAEYTEYRGVVPVCCEKCGAAEPECGLIVGRREGLLVVSEAPHCTDAAACFDRAREEEE